MTNLLTLGQEKGASIADCLTILIAMYGAWAEGVGVGYQASTMNNR